MKTTIPTFKNRNELYKFLKDNVDTLIAEKKFTPKFGDVISYHPISIDGKTGAMKAAGSEETAVDEIKRSVIINTTNIMDSHSDVHIPGLWKKSLSENKNIKFLQEHDMAFDKVIADRADLKAMTKVYSWKELGFPEFKGTTEALQFDTTIRRKRNPFMFDQYANGYVDNHSVGMQYVALVLCINDDDSYYGAEFEAWQKYIEMVVNRSVAEEQGYFWAVKEAKVIEGSAVVLGSNYATPTLSDKDAPGNHAAKKLNHEPVKSTYAGLCNYLSSNLKIN